MKKHMQLETENITTRALKTLSKEYVAVGKTRVRSWHAWLIIGLAVGVLAGVLFVANRSGEFEESLAQTLSSTLKNGLVGGWHFDEISGISASDFSGSGLNGTLTRMDPATDWVSGKVNGALDFDGVNDYVNLGTNLSTLRKTSAVTLVAWIRRESVVTGYLNGVVSFSVNSSVPTKNSRAAIDLSSSGKVRILGRSTDSEAEQVISTALPVIVPNTWHHIAGVIDYAGDSISVYVDGVLKASGPVNFSQSSTPDTLSSYASIGSQDDGSGIYFDGQIDEVYVYRRALDATEITKLFNVASPFITTSSLPNGTVGVAYSAQINSSEASSDAKWNVSSGALPQGLSIITGPIPCATPVPGSLGGCFAPSGYISGTPTTAGTYTFTVTVTSGGQSASKQFTISIIPPISTKFMNGGRVQVINGPVNVRSCSSSTNSRCSVVGAQAAGAVGTAASASTATIPPPNLVASTYPAYVDGFWWWYVNFDSGADGWVAEDYLEKYVAGNKVVILVNRDDYDYLREDLNKFESDVEARFPIFIKTLPITNLRNYSAADVREILINECELNISGCKNMEGAIFVGDVPYALYDQIYDVYAIPQPAPFMFYYQDLDASFAREENGHYFKYIDFGKHEGPEIFISWIKASKDPSAGMSIDQLKRYFDKHHKFFSGEIKPENKAVVALHCPDEAMFSGMKNALGYGIDNLVFIRPLDGCDNLDPLKQTLINALTARPEVAYLHSHGGPGGMWALSAQDLLKMTQQPLLMFTWGCSAGNFYNAEGWSFALSFINGKDLGLTFIGKLDSNDIIPNNEHANYFVNNQMDFFKLWSKDLYAGKAMLQMEQEFTNKTIMVWDYDAKQYKEIAVNLYRLSGPLQRIILGSPFVYRGATAL